MFGRKPNIPGMLQNEPPDVQYTHYNYVKELQSRLQSSYEMAKNNIKVKKEHNKEYYVKKLHDEKDRRGRSLKLSPPWIGPYEVIGVGGVNITLKLPKEQNTQSSCRQTETILWLVPGQ
jgi:hypothetical protein